MDEKRHHADDAKTMRQIMDLAAGGDSFSEMLEAAYHLGRLRGRLEGAESVVKRMGELA